MSQYPHQDPTQSAPPAMPIPPLQPQQLVYAPPDNRVQLRTVAIRQRAIMYCILAYITSFVLQLVLPFPLNGIMALVVLASIVNFVRALAISPGKLFAEWSQLAEVRKVVIPMAIYVSAVPWLGIYLSSALLIAGFMRWLGRYGWLMTLVISIALPILIYFTFEDWFLVPLPKGPLEDWLGL